MLRVLKRAHDRAVKRTAVFLRNHRVFVHWGLIASVGLSLVHEGAQAADVAFLCLAVACEA